MTVGKLFADMLSNASGTDDLTHLLWQSYSHLGDCLTCFADNIAQNITKHGDDAMLLLDTEQYLKTLEIVLFGGNF